jgi:hypothetical protein
MQQLVIITLFFLTSFQLKANIIRTEKCGKEISSDFVYSEDFSWGMSLDEIKKSEELIYLSGKRLKERAYTRDGKVYFPLDAREVEISQMFIEALVKQVENAFKQNYVDALVFPDMGHSHFFIPMDIYKNELRPIKDKKELYEKMYSLPELKILYHTAEQLKMLDENKNLINDKKLIWRYQTRNIVGDMNGSDMEVIVNEKSAFNTAHDYGAEGEYRYWGAGFNISGSKDGCFSYERNGQTYYFDISLKDLESQNPNQNWGF